MHAHIGGFLKNMAAAATANASFGKPAAPHPNDIRNQRDKHDKNNKRGKYDADILKVNEKNLSEKFLIEKLSSYGCYLDKTGLETLGAKALALEEITDSIIEKCVAESLRDRETKLWIFTCVSELWRRWFPDKVILETLADRLERVMNLVAEDSVLASHRVWLKTAPLVLELLDKCGVSSEADFRARFEKYVPGLFMMLTGIMEILPLQEGDEKPFVWSMVGFIEDMLKRLAPDGIAGEAAREFRIFLIWNYSYLNEWQHIEDLCREWIARDPNWVEIWGEWVSVAMANRPDDSRYMDCARLCREGIEAIKGRIDLEPSVAKGALFSLHLFLASVLELDARTIFGDRELWKSLGFENYADELKQMTVEPCTCSKRELKKYTRNRYLGLDLSN